MKTSPLKIAFYAPMKSPYHPVPSGDRTMARNIMKMLCQQGHHVQLISKLRSWEGQGNFQKQRRIQQAAQRTIEKLRKSDPQPPFDYWLTYHLYHKAPDWLGPSLCQFWGIPYGLIEASFAAKQTFGPWAEGLAISKQAIKSADAVWSLSEFDTEAILPLLKPTAIHRKMVPFLDEKSLIPIQKKRFITRQMLRTQWGWNTQDFVWISIGMMRPGAKFESYKILAKTLQHMTDPPIHLVIVGGGEMEQETRRLFQNLPQHRIVFLGTQSRDKTLEILCAADAMVWPAISEAYGMVFLEAHALGLPVIAGQFGGVQEIVVNEQTGLLLPPDPSFWNGSALAQSLVSLQNDPQKYIFWSQNALTKTQKCHSFEAASQGFDILRNHPTIQSQP